MRRVRKLSVWLAAIAIVAGTAISFLPAKWIETFFGVEPDGGSGMLELSIALGFVAVAVAILFYRARRQSRAKTLAASRYADLPNQRSVKTGDWEVRG